MAKKPNEIRININSFNIAPEKLLNISQSNINRATRFATVEWVENNNNSADIEIRSANMSLMDLEIIGGAIVSFVRENEKQETELIN